MYQDADLQTDSRSKPRADQALRVESCISMLEVEREFESPILRHGSPGLAAAAGRDFDVEILSWDETTCSGRFDFIRVVVGRRLSGIQHLSRQITSVAVSPTRAYASLVVPALTHRRNEVVCRER